jgi:imidazolonepropionase
MTKSTTHNPATNTIAGAASYLILRNTSEVVTPDAGGREVLRYAKGAVVFRNGRVLEVGQESDLLPRHPDAEPMDAKGSLVTPGLVDCHTHMIFAGNRAGEFQMKLAGRSYAEIAAAGGGIASTVKATSGIQDDLLEHELMLRLDRWLAQGCTTVEVKSGYGLTPQREIRLLEVIARVAKKTPVRVHCTALALHALPEEYRGGRAQYLEEVRTELLGEIHRRGLAGAIDVFCDPVAFTVEECRPVLTRARELGFPVKLHAEQTERFGGAKLAAEFRALSADHLESANEADWRALTAAGTVGVLLPAAALTLRQKLPEAAIIRAGGAHVAIATDFNPGTAPAQSLLECAALAARLCGFTADETLRAVTWNAARALGAESEIGHLTPGGWGDAVVWDCERLEELPYWLPAVRPMTVLMSGARIESGGR